VLCVAKEQHERQKAQAENDGKNQKMARQLKADINTSPNMDPKA
jgi:hypothetical protein